MSRFSRRASVLTAGMAMVAAVLAGCSSSKASSTTHSSSPSGSAGAPSGPSGTPIVVGMICGCTGPLASSSEVSRPAYTAWVDSVNASGGINGHPIRLIVKDDTSQPATSQAEAHELISSDHVVALVDDSGSDTAWQSFVKSSNVPVIGANVTNLSFLSNADFFSPGQTALTIPTSVAEAAKLANATKLGLVYCAEDPTCQELVPFEKSAAASKGVDLVYNSAVSASAASYTAECLAAKQAGVTALFVADAVQVVERVAQNCSAQGYTPTYIVLDGAVSTAFLKTPGLKDHTISPQPVIPYWAKSVAGVQAMYAAFQKYEPSLLNDPNFNSIVVENWDAGLLLEAALKAGGLTPSTSATSSMILQGLYTMKDQTLGGMAPPLTFTQGHANPVNCWFVGAIQNGSFTTPYGLSPTCS